MTDEPIEGENAEYGMVCSFWIDTPGYSDRDKEMFVCGFEFKQIFDHVRDNPNELTATIHRENESRMRMMCGKFGRSCIIQPVQSEFDPQGEWSHLRIAPREESHDDR